MLLQTLGLGLDADGLINITDLYNDVQQNYHLASSFVSNSLTKRTVHHRLSVIAL